MKFFILERVIEDSLYLYFKDFDYVKSLFISNKFSLIEDYIFDYFSEEFLNNFYDYEIYKKLFYEFKNNLDNTYSLIVSNNEFFAIITFNFDSQNYNYSIATTNNDYKAN